MDESSRYELSVGIQRLYKAAESLIVVAERMEMNNDC